MNGRRSRINAEFAVPDQSRDHVAIPYRNVIQRVFWLSPIATGGTRVRLSESSKLVSSFGIQPITFGLTIGDGFVQTTGHGTFIPVNNLLMFIVTNEGIYLRGGNTMQLSNNFEMEQTRLRPSYERSDLMTTQRTNQGIRAVLDLYDYYIIATGAGTATVFFTVPTEAP